MNLARQAKSWAKSVAADLLFWTGVLSLLARRRLRGHAVVLMYHRVLPAELAARSFSHRGIVVTPETFAKHMDFLERRFRPLSLDEFQHHMESGTPFPERACLVTFDDGWVDNHDYALPILQERGIPAVVFLATDYIDSDRPFWQEYLGHLLYQASAHGLGESVLRSHNIRLPGPEDDASLRQAVADAIDRFRSKSYEDINDLIDKLANALSPAVSDHTASPPDKFMSWQQVRVLSDRGLTVASHSCSHRLLARLDQATVMNEFERSRQALQVRLGLDTCTLAYPGGSYDARVRQSAIDAGFRLGFTTNVGTTRVPSDPMLIPRINIHESATSTIPLFLSRILGIF